MLLKYTLKNIFQKPGRFIILMLCLIAACFFGFLAVDFGGSLKNIVGSLYKANMGKADYILISLSKEGIEGEDFSGAGPVNMCYRAYRVKTETERQEKNYSYAISSEAHFWFFGDNEKAVEMGLCPAASTPGLGEATIGKEYSEKFGIKTGDVITLKDINDEDVEFKVTGIFEEVGALKDGYSGMISKESAYQLLGYKNFKQAYIDLLNDNYEEFEEYMQKEHPGITVINTYGDEAILDLLHNISYILYLLFVLVFALVIFVTISFTEKILTERMSVIGTLRSIGMSMKKTTFILLFENILYGLTGSLLALILYLFVRKIMVNLLSEETLGTGLEHVNIPLFMPVIAGAVLIQLLIPLKEVLKAVKTSIRDIIFENRDTECRISVRKTIAGFALIVVGIIAGLCIDNIVLDIICILLIIVGGGMSIQFTVKFLTEKLAKLFGKSRMPVAELAAFECGTKKTNAGNAVLTIVAVTASLAVFVMGSSMIYAMNKSVYDTDVIISDISESRADDYAYLDDYESITEKEFYYKTYESIRYGGSNDEFFTVWSLPVTDQYTGFGRLPDELADDEIFINITAAQKMRVKAGDTINIRFHSDGLFPKDMTMKVAGISTDDMFGEGAMIMINAENYKELYDDDVNMILIRCSEPDKLVHQLEAALTGGEQVKSNAKLMEETEEDNKDINLILYIITLAAMGLTLVGVSGNQVIGFVSRKKEYAMLHSTACSRKKIVRMILIENALLFGISVLSAAVITVPVVLLIAKVFRLTNLGMIMEARFDTMAGCALLLWLITMLTARTPIRSLKKMNTAVEMKYE